MLKACRGVYWWGLGTLWEGGGGRANGGSDQLQAIPTVCRALERKAGSSEERGTVCTVAGDSTYIR